MPPKCASTESATAVSHQMLWDVRCYKVKQFECFHFAVKRRWGSHVRIKLFIWIIYCIKPKHINCEFARMWILYNIRCKNLAKMQAMGQVLDIVGILQLTILHFKAESLIEFNLLCVSNSIVQSMTNIYPAYNNVTRDRTRVPWHSCQHTLLIFCTKCEGKFVPDDCTTRSMSSVLAGWWESLDTDWQLTTVSANKR